MIEPYYQGEGITLYCGDCREILPQLRPLETTCVSDPPYGIGFGYDQHEDLGGKEYIELMEVMRGHPLALLQYPEEMMRYLVPLFGAPDECFVWCYNANTPRQSRIWGFWGLDIDFSRVQVKPKNPMDPRVNNTVSSYDWTNEYMQVKNISEEKTDHPCQIPLPLMRHVLRLVNKDRIIDPFAGSGSTLLAQKQLGGSAVGIEISEKYCEIAVNRLRQMELFGNLSTP